jgi:transcriptional regulator with PAS, ATPase and Fis domain
LNLLFLGETGVGKDMLASLVHELSPRARGPFVVLDCASVPESLLESEIFGHDCGAFTDATADRPGVLEAANRGTVFLDEIGELSLSLQAKLLRAIEAKEVKRLGATQSRTVDLRFVSATNRNVEQEVAAGRFRLDLYHRLNGMTLTVPPLRRRRSEIEPMAQLFLDGMRERHGLPRQRLSSAAIVALESHAWPGNVRELRNVVERTAVLTQGTVIEARDLALPSLAVTSSNGADVLETTGLSGAGGDAPEASSIERDRLARVLVECGGNQSRAARILGISRRTMVRRMAHLRLPRPRPAIDYANPRSAK